MERIGGKLEQISAAFQSIKNELSQYADGKILKGDELVGWIGEIYGKLLLNGSLVDDKYEHDFEAGDKRVSVKARKGTSSNWKITSIISKIEGDNCPTHLMFLHLDDKYSLKNVWLYPWDEIRETGRFKIKTVREQFRGYYFIVQPKNDEMFVIYRSRYGNNPD